MSRVSTINRMKSAVEIRQGLEEVASGVRGFVSHTKKRAESTGIKVESVEKWALRLGLAKACHGRLGSCFSRQFQAARIVGEA